MRTFIAIVLLCLLFILALIFGAKNEQMVTISYFVAEGEYRLPFVLAVVFFSGFVLSWLLAFFYIAKLKLALRKSNNALAKFVNIPASTAVRVKPQGKAS